MKNDISLITNNCIGGSILHDLNLRFNSPTINLQIFPEEFSKFCVNLKHYIDTDIVEYKPEDITDYHKNCIKKMYDNRLVLDEFPYGLCDDIIIAFQHYKTFDEAKSCWDRRKKRINYNHLGYIFYARQIYKKEAVEFSHLHLPNSVLFTENFDVDGEHYRIRVPKGKLFLAIAPNGKKYFEKNFNKLEYIKQIEGSGV